MDAIEELRELVERCGDRTAQSLRPVVEAGTVEAAVLRALMPEHTDDPTVTAAELAREHVEHSKAERFVRAFHDAMGDSP